MIIDAISDLHGHYPELEGGDLLIVAGDLTAHDTEYEIDEFSDWIDELKYKKIIIIAGNHDNYCQLFPDTLFGVEKAEYLCDSSTEFDGLKIWGSPWTKTFEGMNPKCKAFTVDTDEELAEKWALIPKDTDILITHCPPYGIMDEVIDKFSGMPTSVGSESLLKKVFEIKAKLHVFGHVHEQGSSIAQVGHLTRFVNASILSEGYEPLNRRIRVIL